MKQLPFFARSWSSIALLIWGCLLTVGCPSVEPQVRAEDRQDSSLPQSIGIREEAPGHFTLRSIPPDLAAGAFVELVGLGPWPTGQQNRPGQAILLVVVVDGDRATAIPIGQRSALLDVSQLAGRVVERPRLSFSKSVTWIVSRSDNQVQLAAGMAEGVAVGDLFFVLGEPQGETERLGSRIVATLRVAEVTGRGARADIVHEVVPVGPDEVAIFAQHVAPTAKCPEVSILFANTHPELPVDANQMPPLANAVIEYQADFQFTNMVVEPRLEHIDPAATDAVEQAWQLAPDVGFGVVVMGREGADDFLYNITTYGPAPGPVTSVGILPGGLLLPMPHGIDALSRQLAPSFLAAALTLRGDHAQAIYFLEVCLRQGLIQGPVAFHLREHLALRYADIGRLNEGLWLMTRDIADGREMGNAAIELNALSIREFLHRSALRFQPEYEDIEAFLDRAEDFLPDESLLGERLERSRALGRLERMDDALAAIEEVSQQARRQSDLRLEVSSALARAGFLVQKGDHQVAIRIISEVLSSARTLGEDYPQYAHLLLAQVFTELRQYEDAMLNLRAAIDYALADDNRYITATTYEAAANIQFAFDEVPEALIFMRMAMQLYGEVNQYADLARAAFQSGMIEMNLAIASADQRLVQLAFNDLSLAAETFLAIGDGFSAAQSFGGLGLASLLVGNDSQALYALSRSAELAQQWEDPLTVVAAYRRMADIYIEQGDSARARQTLETARLWAVTFGYDEALQDIDSQLQALYSEV